MFDRKLSSLKTGGIPGISPEVLSPTEKRNKSVMSKIVLAIDKKALSSEWAEFLTDYDGGKNMTIKDSVKMEKLQSVFVREQRC